MLALDDFSAIMPCQHMDTVIPPPQSNDMPNARRSTDLDRAIASRLREARWAKGLTQVEVANAIGVSFQQMQKYERGTNRITVGRLHRLASALGVPLSQLLAFDAPDRPPIPIAREEARMLSAYRLLPSGLASAFRDLVTQMARSQTGAAADSSDPAA